MKIANIKIADIKIGDRAGLDPGDGNRKRRENGDQQ